MYPSGIYNNFENSLNYLFDKERNYRVIEIIIV